MKILFLCVENAGRSQMAEAFARRHALPGAEIFSAGSQPAERIHPAVADAMREIGIELAGQTPKGLPDLPEGTFDLAVTMGCGDSCPAVQVKRVVAWEVQDPKDQPPETVRGVRDEISRKVRRLLAEQRPIRLRRWTTLTGGLVLAISCLFLLSASLISPALGVPRPEKALALVSGRTLQLREGLASLPPWERRLHAFLDPRVGGPEEISELIGWHRELLLIRKDPALVAHLGILEGESGGRDLLDRQTRRWAEEGPFQIPVFAWLLRSAYLEKPSPSFSQELETWTLELLPPGWFRDRLQQRIASAIGDQARAQELEAANGDQEKRLLGRYRWMSGLDLAVLGLFLVSLRIYSRRPRPFWKSAAASIPLPWAFPTGISLLIQGAGLGILLAFAASFLPLPPTPLLSMAWSLSWTLPILWIARIRLLRPNGLRLREELGLETRPHAAGKFLVMALLGLGLDSVGGWLIGTACGFLNLPNHWAESFDPDLVWGGRTALLTGLAGIVLAGPFFEEAVFRGLLYGTLRTRFRRAGATALSAAVFSLLHGYGVFGFLTVFWSGVVFAWVYEEGGSLWPAVAAHAAGNLLFSANVIAMLRM